jgi:hypothetical protein
MNLRVIRDAQAETAGDETALAMEAFRSVTLRQLPRVVFLADLVPRGGEAPWLPPRVGREAHSASQVAEASDARVFAEQSDGKERREDAPR